MKISFVIPCYKSAKTLRSVIEEIIETVIKNGDEYEIVLVNDCSPDSTYEVISELCKNDRNIIGIDQAKNFGQHAALMAGFHFVTGEIVVCLDDDGQTPPKEMYKLIRKIDEKNDVVYAKYAHKKHSLFRNIGSLMNRRMTEIMLGKPRDLYVSSYFAMKKFIVDEIIKYSNAYPYVIGLVLRSTRHICNVDVNQLERKAGDSGYNMRKLLALWMNGFTSFSIIPLRFATYSGGVVAFIGFVYAFVTVIRKLIDPTRLLGWSSTISIILVLGGLILCVLGMLGEYVGRIYISINRSPQYVVRNVINYHGIDKPNN